jgi:hypothetical protein
VIHNNLFKSNLHSDKVQAYKPNSFGQTLQFELPSCILEYQVTLQKWLSLTLRFGYELLYLKYKS